MPRSGFRRGGTTPRNRHLADLINIHDVDSLRHVDDGGCLVLSEENLFGMPYNDGFAIDPNLEGPERPLLEGGFEVRQFHGVRICCAGRLSSPDRGQRTQILDMVPSVVTAWNHCPSSFRNLRFDIPPRLTR